MTAEAFKLALRRRIAHGDRSELSLAQLCAACAEVTSLPASIVLATESHPQAAMATSDEAVAVAELQFTLGEGPGVDAHADGCPVLVEDLAAAASRWVHFVPSALALGVRAVFALPLHVGVIRTGREYGREA